MVQGLILVWIKLNIHKSPPIPTVRNPTNLHKLHHSLLCQNQKLFSQGIPMKDRESNFQYILTESMECSVNIAEYNIFPITSYTNNNLAIFENVNYTQFKHNPLKAKLDKTIIEVINKCHKLTQQQKQKCWSALTQGRGRRKRKYTTVHF